MSFTTQTPKQDAAAEYEAALERAQHERARAVDRITNPKRGEARLDPGAINRAEERITIAQANLETARAAAAKEARLLPTEERLWEILSGVAASLDGAQGDISEASAVVIEAVAELNAKIDQYNLIVPSKSAEQIRVRPDRELRDADERRWARLDGR